MQNEFEFEKLSKEPTMLNFGSLNLVRQQSRTVFDSLPPNVSSELNAAWLTSWFGSK